MRHKEDRYVNMTSVIGELAFDYNIPVMRFDQLVELGKRSVAVYGLEDHSKKIPFADLCEYIIAFIKTPFGEKTLLELSKDN